MTALLLLAAALPGLYVDADPSAALPPAGLDCVSVPAARAEAWKGRCAHPVDPARLVRLPSPGVQYRMNVAQATSAPWVNSNGWRYARGAGRPALVEAEAGKAALAAAEAFAWGAEVLVAAKPEDWAPFAAMVQFLAALGPDSGPALADIGFLDDGSPAAAENMNLFLRRNLMFRVVKSPDPALQINVPPKAGDPSAYAYEIRQKLGDARRTLRLFGNEVVLARATGSAGRRRVYLLNFGNRPVEGVRVRLLGKWPNIQLRTLGEPVQPADVTVTDTATEFSVPRLPLLVVAELSQ